METRFGHLSRRTAIGVLAAGAGAFALFGAKRDRSIPPGRLVLDYWEKWTGHEGSAMQAIVDEFNASQNKLFVRYLITNTVHQKAMIAILGGNPPDIIGLNSFSIPTYADANALLPLDDLAPAHGVHLNDYAPGMHAVMRFGGRWFGTINTAGTLALYWNKSIFSQHAEQLRARGLPPDHAPATIEELDSANQVLSRCEKNAPLGTAPLDRAGFLHMEPGWWSWIWPQMFGGSLYDPSRDAAIADAPACLRAYEWMQRTSKLLGVEHVQKFQAGLGPYGTPQQGFLTGKVAMVVQGPWLANEIRKRAPQLDYGVAPLPMTEQLVNHREPLTCIDTDVLVIPSGAKHPEASMQFIAYTQRQRNAEALATAHCKGSPMARVSDDFLAEHPNRGVALHSSMARSPRAFVSPATPAWTEYKDVIDSAAQDIWKHALPASAALANVQRAGQAIFDRHHALRARRNPK